MNTRSIYTRMASSDLTKATHRSEGEFPHRVHIVRFTYANGLEVDFYGDRWVVVKEERPV
jgi:hypothetical protein